MQLAICAQERRARNALTVEVIYANRTHGNMRHLSQHILSFLLVLPSSAAPESRLSRSRKTSGAKERLARDGWQPQNPTTVPDRAALLLSCVGAACGSCQGFSRPALSTLCDSCVTQSTNKKTANEYMRPVIEWKNSRHEIGTTTQHA